MRLVSILYASVKLRNHEPVRNKDSNVADNQTCGILIPMSKEGRASGSTEWNIFQPYRGTGLSDVGALVA